MSSGQVSARGRADLRGHARADRERRSRKPIDRHLLRRPADRAPATADDGDEPPEPLVGGTIDLGALATEFLLLGIDPYPRKAGAEFAPPKAEDDGAHPFAALEALKKRSGSGKP